MKPIIYLLCNLVVLIYGIHAAAVHGGTLAWLIVLTSIIVGLAISGKFGFGPGQFHKISWRRTALHGRIRPVVHRHY
ncbi:hypothetical protein JIN84_12665 [Luteolibacter yonseiensis]|uniref:Uncharacterized protein n=1 Tax=Luteolibacter yonseiensis TaxID=1144680 RepID=A0A934VC03_9BACT|nr:hypothetical protein [Luteolibacter yonseiensis]MBK1816471.1 hypothetical protein [Luteolibacter yonseiensis]